MSSMMETLEDRRLLSASIHAEFVPHSSPTAHMVAHKSSKVTKAASRVKAVAMKPQATATTLITQDLLVADFAKDPNAMSNFGAYSGWYVGMSRINDVAPTVSNGAAHLAVHTYNPVSPGTFTGAELDSNQVFGFSKANPKLVGYTLNVRFKFTNIARGKVAGLTMYTANAGHQEIDNEQLTNQAMKTGTRTVDTNLFLANGGVKYKPVTLPASTNFSGWNTLSINWSTWGQVAWSMNGVLIRYETGFTPGDMRVMLNYWEAHPAWDVAADTSIHATKNPLLDQVSSLDIQYVGVQGLFLK